MNDHSDERDFPHLPSTLIFFEGPERLNDRIEKALELQQVCDRQWFSKHPERRLAARPLTDAERLALFAFKGLSIAPSIPGHDYAVVVTATGACQYVTVPVPILDHLCAMSEAEILAAQVGIGLQFVGHTLDGREWPRRRLGGRVPVTGLDRRPACLTNSLKPRLPLRRWCLPSFLPSRGARPSRQARVQSRDARRNPNPRMVVGKVALCQHRYCHRRGEPPSCRRYR